MEIQKNEDFNKFKEFIDILKNEYVSLRNSFDSNISDDELLNNENFKKCFKITNIMSTAFSSEDGMENLYILANSVGFDINKLLDSFDVIKTEENKYPIVIEKNDSES